MLKTKLKEIYNQHTVEVYQSICVFFFITIIALLSILEFKSGVMEGYKATFALLKTRSDEQIREIAILQEHYKYHAQEIAQLRARVIASDGALRRDIEDLKQQQNPPIKHLRK